MLLTQFGEASLSMGGKTYLVRPSLKAIASIGRPEDIEQVMQDVCDAFHVLRSGHLPKPLLISACANVLEICSNIPAELLGFCVPSKINGKLLYKAGKIPLSDIIIMANHCIKWGIQGDPKWKPKPSKTADDGRAFDPVDFVSILIDEFHLSREDAWNTTMTEFQRLCEQRVRTMRGNKPPPIDDESARKVMTNAREIIKRARELGIKPIKRNSSRSKR